MATDSATVRATAILDTSEDCILGIQDIPGTSDMPGIPDIPGTSDIPGIPDVPRIPDISGVMIYIVSSHSLIQ